MFVTDLPLWTDHGLDVPKELEVRSNGKIVAVVHYHNGKINKHVVVSKEEFTEENLPIMLNNLGFRV